MVSKEACYKGPPFKTRFHELDAGWVSGLGKGKKRCATLRRDRVSRPKYKVQQTHKTIFYRQSSRLDSLVTPH